MPQKIAFQGELGAYGHQACAQARPDFEPLPCETFDDAIEFVRKGDADLGMIAVENSTYGRVADVHSLLPESGLHIVDESFVRVHVNLLAKKGAILQQIRQAYGHPVILPQCAGFLRENTISPHATSDNARAAREVAEGDDGGEFFSQLASHWKKNYNGWTAWMLTPDLKLPTKMRLKESRRVPMWNGPIECRMFRFDLMKGSVRDKL